MGIKCSACDAEFIDSKALSQHKQAKHSEGAESASAQVLKRIERKEEKKAERAQELKSQRTGKFLKYGGFLAVIILVGFGISSMGSNQNQTSYTIKGPAGSGSGQSAGIIPTEPIHWHPMLTIKINGQAQDIPPEIGLGPTVHQPVHTHTDDLVNGARLIHLENNRPTTDNMKLGFFFQVWNKKFNKECILDVCNSGDKKVKFTVNGKENADFENYIMADGDKMVIEYG